MGISILVRQHLYIETAPRFTGRHSTNHRFRIFSNLLWLLKISNAFFLVRSNHPLPRHFTTILYKQPHSLPKNSNTFSSTRTNWNIHQNWIVLKKNHKLHESQPPFYGMLSSWHDKSTESFLWLSHFCFMILMESAIMYSKDAGDFLGWGYWTKCHCPLTHWGPVTHVCVGKPTIIEQSVMTFSLIPVRKVPYQNTC